MNIEKLYTMNELADILQINKQTVIRFVREGKIKAVKIGREYRVKVSSLESYINSNTLSTEKIDGSKV